jgi:type I restriction enzyme R subunit
LALVHGTALKYYRLQKISEGSISLIRGKQEPVDVPDEVGTGAGEKVKDELSNIIGYINERFKTDFTPADELFLASIARP